jgi:hypothetical protein
MWLTRGMVILVVLQEDSWVAAGVECGCSDVVAIGSVEIGGGHSVGGDHSLVFVFDSCLS